MKIFDGYVISKELKVGKFVKFGVEEIIIYIFKNEKFVGKVVFIKIDVYNKEKFKNVVFFLFD